MLNKGVKKLIFGTRWVSFDHTLVCTVKRNKAFFSAGIFLWVRAEVQYDDMDGALGVELCCSVGTNDTHKD